MMSSLWKLSCGRHGKRIRKHPSTWIWEFCRLPSAWHSLGFRKSCRLSILQGPQVRLHDCIPWKANSALLILWLTRRLFPLGIHPRKRVLSAKQSLPVSLCVACLCYFFGVLLYKCSAAWGPFLSILFCVSSSWGPHSSPGKHVHQIHDTLFTYPEGIPFDLSGSQFTLWVLKPPRKKK